MPHSDQLERLREALALVIKDCQRFARPAHAVGNCPSDLQNLDAAWRKRQNLEYQIHQLEKSQ